MNVQPSIAFPPFRLDVTNEQLWRDTHIVGLRHKTFAVLRYLVARPGQLVTKEEMLEALWPGTVVTDAALKICVRELRKALGDDDRAPRFI
jgi:DNA-binding winged helix-turn-helix (wHTH) protein